MKTIIKLINSVVFLVVFSLNVMAQAKSEKKNSKKADSKSVSLKKGTKSDNDKSHPSSPAQVSGDGTSSRPRINNQGTVNGKVEEGGVQ
jgi:hypothetical protein